MEFLSKAFLVKTRKALFIEILVVVGRHRGYIVPPTSATSATPTFTTASAPTAAATATPTRTTRTSSYMWAGAKIKFIAKIENFTKIFTFHNLVTHY
jgi:hypothetical protein